MVVPGNNYIRYYSPQAGIARLGDRIYLVANSLPDRIEVTSVKGGVFTLRQLCSRLKRFR
jgi:hypothetical protein